MTSPIHMQTFHFWCYTNRTIANNRYSSDPLFCCNQNLYRKTLLLLYWKSTKILAPQVLILTTELRALLLLCTICMEFLNHSWQLCLDSFQTSTFSFCQKTPFPNYSHYTGIIANWKVLYRKGMLRYICSQVDSEKYVWELIKSISFLYGHWMGETSLEQCWPKHYHNVLSEDGDIHVMNQSRMTPMKERTGTCQPENYNGLDICQMLCRGVCFLWWWYHNLRQPDWST